ncbi:S41 family peptidase [Acidihalobacter aeolianus]|uniref:S41 family peptidase n=1 Tax=Acidihalobacter aeolianus TaxID=2792603 RepID=UPI000A565A32|nr:S41 family peptidase [Acidihalobacter aeolianus]
MKSASHTRRRRLTPIVLVFVFGLVAGVFIDRQYLAGVVPAAVVPLRAVPDFLLMSRAWNLIDAHYVDRASIKPKDMTYAAISGMVDSLGDTGHSTFLTPDMVKMADSVISGHFAGIGAEVRLKGRQVIIVTPLDGTPAQRAHLRPGDIILKVDGKDVTGQPLGEVVDHIRGPVGTEVVLELMDPTTGKTRTVTLVRAKIPIHTVSWHMLPGTAVADVRISSFSKGTAEELSHALAAAREAGARGILLDLRNDPGGLLTEAIDVASQFVTSGNVMLERNVRGRVRAVPVNPDVPKIHLPVVILVNGGTASAAEIVAGALKDDLHAPLIGEKTFGTGTVLQQFMLPDGAALLLAVEEWLTPNGHSFWHKGLAPTEKVALPANALMLRPDAMKDLTTEGLRKSDDTQLLAGLKMLEQRMQKTAQETVAVLGTH